ncbi:MAG TPA: GNAT family N-acetyltransferase [Spirochaetota bacterium]|nr:GNAT family N-acetyltransferase [Spirochaetota bacterium]HOJ29453.1 GNAT family N-acetyltransferase [Spirochaetota bacterium]HOM10608.1 GNAT family N-acetyltransferase [Spirochaetota bacterium]HPP50384.1 GNAT family N-acetyltransferase [Spirochaetota bacterium]HXK65281.1 GNAT family N-acetyltransferase [Spirochaetota bacterium]
MYDIREATLSDIDDIVTIRMKMLFELGKLETEDGTRKLRSLTRDFFIRKFQTGEFKVFCALKDETIIATTGIQFLERPPLYENPHGIEAYIMNVYTEPEYRGKGVASKLLEKVIEHAKERKAGRILLHAIGKDKRIYEKAGFVSTTDEMQLVLQY